MKNSFRKIMAIGASVVLTSMTFGMAAAANYPAPFVQGGNADVAVVYGSDASLLDGVQAGNIQADLQSYLTGTSDSRSDTTVTGGDAFKFEKTTAKLHLGKGILDVVSTNLDEDELSTVLAKGTYVDDDNDEFDFKQKIAMNNNSLELFDDNDYSRDDPTVGIQIADGANILNYTLDFTTTPLWSDLTNTDLTILGKEYYILSTSGNDTLTLLDSADSTILNEGETVTVNGKEVSISFIGTSNVKLTVDGSTTNSLAEGDTQKLADDSYIGIKDILVQDYQGGTKQVEFSLGTGKLVIANGTTVEMNSENVDGIEATITNAASDTKLDTVVLQWNSDEKTFITETSDATMPGFEAVKLSYGGFSTPAEEEFVVEADGDNSLVLSNFKTEKDTGDINLLYSNGTAFTALGYDTDNKLATANTGENLTFIKGTHDYFVLSYASGDAAESYVVRASSFDDGANDTKGDADDTAKIEYRSGDSWIEVDAAAILDDVIEIGSASMTIESVNDSSDTLVVSASGSSNFNELYSAEGLKVWLPWINTTEVTVPSGTNSSDAADACVDAIAADLINSTMGTAQLAYNQVVNWQNDTSGDAALTTTCQNFPATYTLLMKEEDKDGSIASGNAFNLTIGYATSGSNNVVSVTTVGDETPDGGYEVGQSTQEYLSYVNGPLATKILHDKDGTQDFATVTYHGGESYGELFISEPGTTITGGTTTTSGTQLGQVLVKDTDVSNVAGKNLIVVGGSCINSAAAALVGGAYCGSAWTDATGVGSGQFLIKGYEDNSLTDEMALLVAGYEAADTANAATYLLTQDVDTGAEYIGTTSTNAELQVE